MLVRVCVIGSVVNDAGEEADLPRDREGLWSSTSADGL
jgi:hypothetical protein